MGSHLNSFPDHIKRFEPATSRGFISHLSPNPLLSIEPRLVRREVHQAKTCMGPQEIPNLFTFMPSGTIYIQPDRISSKSTIDLPQTGEEPLSVPLRTPQQSHPSQQRGNPSKNVQPFVMLAGSQDPKPMANFSPPSTQTRMQGKTGLIFKDNGLLSSQGPEFFLICGETAWHPRYATADRYSLLASSGTPTDASTTEPGVPSGVSQIDSSGGPLRSDHPSGLDSNQIPQATSPNALPTHVEPAGSAELVSQVSLPALGIADLVHSPCASTSSSSDVSNRALRLSIPDADPPVSAEEPQSLFPQRLPGFPELLSTKRLGFLRDELTSDLVFA
jgi:hypothetical protein